MRFIFLICAALIATVCEAASASETTTYTYDALGRLTTSNRSGTVNNGVATNTTFDPAGNRTTYVTTGSGSLVIVVPLNGFTIIPIPTDE